MAILENLPVSGSHRMQGQQLTALLHASCNWRRRSVNTRSSKPQQLPNPMQSLERLLFFWTSRELLQTQRTSCSCLPYSGGNLKHPSAGPCPKQGLQFEALQFSEQ